MRQYDIANGPGIRSTIFVTGCSRHCFNCFNPEYQDPRAGQEWTDKEMEQLLSWLSAPTNSGLTLLGGEPMENTDGLTQIVQNVKQAMPDKSVWVYSGFTYDEIIQDPQKKALLDVCDVLVDGPFVDDLKTRASTSAVPRTSASSTSKRQEPAARSPWYGPTAADDK